MPFRRATPAALSLLATLATLLSGCALYFHGDDDEPPVCDVAVAPSELVRDPQTGVCRPQPHNDPCSDLALPLPHLPGGICGSFCEQLGEAACIAESGCQAAYVESCPTGKVCVESHQTFAGCWATAGGNVEEPSARCEAFDAFQCAASSSCSLVYTAAYTAPKGEPVPSMPWTFTGCQTEQPIANACELIDCPPDRRCEVTCSTPPPVGCLDPAGNPTKCPDVCKATCVLVGQDPGACRGEILCKRAAPACPIGTTPGIADGCYTGYCIPVADCGHDPGHCYDPVICRIAPPACPTGTVPGVADGCYTGYCIPVSACEGPLPCALLDGPACLARTDCEPVYKGDRCTCTPAGCTCADSYFDQCVDDPPRP